MGHQLAADRAGEPTLMVIDRQGRSIDRMWIGPVYEDGTEADHAWVRQFRDFIKRRLLVSDPVFAVFSEFLRCRDDDVVA